MNLSESVFSVLKSHYSKIDKLSSSPKIWAINYLKCNIRTASEKSGDKYWFDVTPKLYEANEVDYFIYVCGTPDSIYIFPCSDFSILINGAHLGGQKQVPNFTIFDNSSEFEPAGHSQERHGIAKYKNAFGTIPEI